MLGKLMKYDLRYCLRRFVPLWIAAVALSAVSGLYFRVVNNASEKLNVLFRIFIVLLPMLLFGVFVAMGVMTLVFICRRFYRGLLGDEGYLMHTLPVTAGAHIASKGLTALILEIVSGLVALLCVFLVPATFQPSLLAAGWQYLTDMLRSLDFPAGTPWLIAEMLLAGLAMSAAETLKLFAAIALGHLAKAHRALWAVLAYIGINFTLNSLVSVGIFSGLADRILRSGSWSFFTAGGEISSSGIGFMAGSIGSGILWELLLGTGFFFLTRFILKKHLNLE